MGGRANMWGRKLGSGWVASVSLPIPDGVNLVATYPYIIWATRGTSFASSPLCWHTLLFAQLHQAPFSYFMTGLHSQDLVWLNPYDKL